MLRPRHESPTPLLRVVLPLLVLTPVEIWMLGADHPWEQIVPAYAAAFLLAGLMTFCRSWWATVSWAVALAGSAWVVGLIVVLLLHPPE